MNCNNWSDLLTESLSAKVAFERRSPPPHQFQKLLKIVLKIVKDVFSSFAF